MTRGYQCSVGLGPQLGIPQLGIPWPRLDISCSPAPRVLEWKCITSLKFQKRVNLMGGAS